MATLAERLEMASLSERRHMVEGKTGSRPIEPVLLRQIDQDNDLRRVVLAPALPSPRMTLYQTAVSGYSELGAGRVGLGGGELAEELGRAAPIGPGRGRPRDPDLEVAIRVATMALLGEVGYARLSMERVARRAGVSKASLYLRWPNKLALVTDALARTARPVPDIPDTGSLPGDMRTFLGALLESRSRAGRALAGVSAEIVANPALRKAWHLGVGGTLTSCLREILSRAVERGELGPDADVDLLVNLPLSLLQSWQLEHGDKPDQAVVQRIVRQFYTPETNR